MPCFGDDTVTSVRNLEGMGCSIWVALLGAPLRRRSPACSGAAFITPDYPRPGWSSRTLDSAVGKSLAVRSSRGWCRATSDTSTTTTVPTTMGRISEPRVGWPSCHTESTSHSTDKGRKGPASRLAGYWSRTNWALASPRRIGSIRIVL